MGRGQIVKLTAEEIESALAGALDCAKKAGWSAVRLVTCSPGEKKCCAVGALGAVGLSSQDRCFDDFRLTVALYELGRDQFDLSDALIEGFDGKPLSDYLTHSLCRSFHDAGRNLAAIFVDGAK
jgi:hypothetical protein